VNLNGYIGDSAFTFEVGEVAEEVRNLVLTTRECLYAGIKSAIVGNRVGDIGFAVQSLAESKGYGVVRELVGHGVGKSLHESPEIPNYGKQGKGKNLVAGMTIAIEPMINMGTREVVQEKDGWTIRTRDRKPSAHFEHTLAITENGPDILSSHEEVERIILDKKKNV
jgi:methionyl aminopeptidase